MGVDRAGLAVAILFLVFIAYEIAGGSPRFPDLHTASYFGSRILWVKITLLIVPPAIYVGWLTWHLERLIPK